MSWSADYKTWPGYIGDVQLEERWTNDGLDLYVCRAAVYRRDSGYYALVERGSMSGMDGWNIDFDAECKVQEKERQKGCYYIANLEELEAAVRKLIK